MRGPLQRLQGQRHVDAAAATPVDARSVGAAAKQQIEDPLRPASIAERGEYLLRLPALGRGAGW